MPPDGIVFRWIILVLAIFAVNYFEFQSVVSEMFKVSYIRT